uniref:Alpha-L-iduronidase n=1 Tax=Ciona savignyi TaxID=51511 RepID=H2ZMG5_CIOSA
PLQHFWESTGLCPPLPHTNASHFLLSKDMKLNILLISSTPHTGMKRLRVHWLLDLITKSGKNYNFVYLDQFIQLLHENYLYPGFELMGNPSNHFSDFDNMTQVRQWQNLVHSVAERYIIKYGKGYVKNWLFETWNEPDHKDWDGIKMSVTGFLKYYDACSEGIKQASRSLTFGGPGASCRDKIFSKRCWALFKHCVNGTNYITGKIGSRLDYISFHKKGHSDATSILTTELETITKIHAAYKPLVNTPIVNDEADPLVGWNKSMLWRADATYAALVTKVISEHQHQIIANKSRKHINYMLLSNDNAFLSYAPHFFTQRTLNARFQVNNTNPKYVFLVRKPVLTVMGLLAKLGDVQLKQLITSKQQNLTLGGVSSICTKCQNLEISTVIYNSENVQTSKVITKLTLEYTSTTTMWPIRHMFCKLDNVLTNPHKVWMDAGSPLFPEPHLFYKMQIASEPHCTNPKTFRHFDKFDVSMRLPSILLHQICEKPAKLLASPNNLQLCKISQKQVLIKWQDSNIQTKCIMTYNIEFASNGPNFQSINNNKVLFNSFVHSAVTHLSLSGTVYGHYRVQAIDFWGRPGQYSKVVKY